MAEDSYWWTTDDTGDGAASGYTQVELGYVAKVLAACSGFEGVAPGFLNQMACTANGANTVAVNTGGAVVDGKPYYNSASVDVTIASAVGGGNTRIDRIVLRAGWAAQTVRITRIAGTDAASPTAPALTQTPGTTYDISLCTVLVTTDGTVTVTDDRTMAGSFWRRKGGSATDWSSPGTTTYTTGGVRIQAGAVTEADSSISVTFPIAYPTGKDPIVLLTSQEGTPNILRLSDVSNSGFVVAAYLINGNGAATTNFHWLSIGAAD